MMQLKRGWQKLSWPEAMALTAIGVVIALVLLGRLEPLSLVILLIISYFGWMARGVVEQADRVRPVEPYNTWLLTMVANLGLMALGIGSFGWYLLGGGSLTWVPFLIFMAGMIALRQWRKGVVLKLYAWRTPALTLLQQGEYRQLVRALEDEAIAGEGHPDKLAMVALAYIELNKWQRADDLLKIALRRAPNYASVNGALGSLRRHQARYSEAVDAIRVGLRFEDNVNSAYYLGLNQFLAGDMAGAQNTLLSVIDNPTLIRQGQVYGVYMLGQIAEQAGDSEAARRWYDRMAEGAPKVIPALQEEARRHKQTPYGDTLKEHVRNMEHIIARRPLAERE